MKQLSAKADEPTGRAALNRTGATNANGAPLRRPGAIGFAAALLARYGLHHSARGVEQVLRRTPRARPMHCWHQWFSLRIAALIRLSLGDGPVAADDSPAAHADAVATPGDPVRMAGYRSVERLVQRLLHTTMQLSTAPAAVVKSRARVQEARTLGFAPQAGGRALLDIQQVPRVLRQPDAKPPAIPSEPSAATPTNTEMQRRLEIDRNERSARRPEPLLDLVRMRRELTRDVVRTLDRRVIAHRERMGRT